MNQRIADKKSRRTTRRPLYLASWHKRVSLLKQVERKMNGLFRQIVERMDTQQVLGGVDKFDVLVSTFPELRLANLGQHPAEVRELLSRLDPENGPLPGFTRAMEQLCALCITPQEVRSLRSALYTVAARVVDNCPELLSSVALAALSLNGSGREPNVFLEMVVTASAIEWLIRTNLGQRDPIPFDVDAWLAAAEPSDALRAMVGEGLAYYYAAIAGVYPFLDQGRVLFDVQQLTPYARRLFQSSARDGAQMLSELVDASYRSLLRAEIKRAQSALQSCHPAQSIADVVMLTNRALEALDDLPPQVNPLLQAIFVQSLARYVIEA